jgi:hypothetical protein
MWLVMQYRGNAASCRARAISEPMRAIHWLGEAQRWERLAEAEVCSHFIECNATSSSDLACESAWPLAPNRHPSSVS